MDRSSLVGAGLAGAIHRLGSEEHVARSGLDGLESEGSAGVLSDAAGVEKDNDALRLGCDYPRLVPWALFTVTRNDCPTRS